jgi:GntR family transcriptional regulator
MVTVTGVDIVIDPHSKEPSYRQLARQLRAAITSGEIAPREAIPSYKQLIEATGLAMGTVQKAIRELEREHLVYTVSGRGTFVTPRNLGADG